MQEERCRGGQLVWGQVGVPTLKDDNDIYCALGLRLHIRVGLGLGQLDLYCAMNKTNKAVNKTHLLLLNYK